MKQLPNDPKREAVLATKIRLLEKEKSEALAENVRLWHKIEALQTELELTSNQLIVMHDNNQRILQNEDGLSIRARCFGAAKNN